MVDCDSDIKNFCELRGDKYYNTVFKSWELRKITAYVKEDGKEDGKEIEVKLRSDPDAGPNGRQHDEWRVKDNSSYSYKKIYLKAGTEWWFKYHILSFNEECIRTHIEQFDKNEMFTYAVTYGKLPEDIEQSDSSTTDNDKNILSILSLLKPDSLNDRDNYNILLIACTRYNLKLVKFLVDNCGIKLSVSIRKGFFSSYKYLLNEIAIDYVTNDSHYNSSELNYIKINIDELHNFMDRLISYASEQNPVVRLVNQDVLTDAKKYREENIAKYKSEIRTNESDYYPISEESGGYIHWLNSKSLPPPKSVTATVCDKLTPGCFKTRRVHVDAGGSKKRAKKTRKQRKHRNLKRNHKK